MKTLETPRLLLRDWQKEDAEDLYHYAKDPEVGPAAGWKPHESIEESRDILDKMFLGSTEVWAIVSKEDGRVIGSLGLHGDSKRAGVPGVKMLGYVLSREYWGRGLMTEAAKAALAYAFEEEKLQMVSVFHFPFNGRSRRVIEKCGFRREGFLRMATCQYNGKILDEVCYSLTADEYWAGKDAEKK